jgi:hypothetical protein
MDVYISAERMLPVLKVDDKIAAKMLEVYDKARKFEPVEIDDGLTIQVDTNSEWPVEILVHGRHKIISLGESRQLRKVLEAAENYVESHREQNGKVLHNLKV